MPDDTIDARQLQALHASRAMSAILIGVADGMRATGTGPLPIAIGFGAALEHYGTALILASYREHGDDGIRRALSALHSMLDDLRQQFQRTAALAPRSQKAPTN